MMRRYSGYTAVKTGNGRHVYVADKYHPFFAEVLEKHRKNYHFTSILRTVNLLNADASRGTGLNPAGDTRAIQLGNVGMRYNVHNGAVFIQTLAFTAVDGTFKTGLYQVEYSKDEREWLPEKKPIKHLSDTKQWQSGTGKASYVAISGRFSDIQSASRMMPQHLTGGYQKADLLTKSGAGKEYALFWNEKGAHASGESAQALASIMQQTAKNTLPVNWLVHDKGIDTFINAAKILKPTNADKAANQNVYFSNPSSSVGENTLKSLCADAGLTYVGLNTNFRDLKRWNSLKNVGCEMGKQFSTAVLSGGGVATVGATVAINQVGLEKAVNGMVSGLSSNNYLLLGAGAVATGIAVAGLVKKSTTLGAMLKCTLGRGNAEWYTDDKSLLF